MTPKFPNKDERARDIEGAVTIMAEINAERPELKGCLSVIASILIDKQRELEHDA